MPHDYSHPFVETTDMYNIYRFYKLVDPRNDAIRYIGQTTKSLERRLSSHVNIALKNGRTVKDKWILGMSLDGYSPIILLLEEDLVSGGSALYRERQWIYHHRLQGHQLTNSTHNNPWVLKLLAGTDVDVLNSDIIGYTEYAIELLSWHSLISSRELSSSMHRDRKECKARIHQLSEYGKLPQVIVDRITSKLNFEQLQERM